MKFSRELGVSAIPPAENEANTTYARRTVKAKAKHQGANSSGPSGNQKRSTANTHYG